MDIKKIYNGNCYLDGTSSQVGRVAELTLPELATKTEVHSALGMFGEAEFPTGLTAMNAKVKWNGFYGDVLEKAANPLQSVKLQFRANVQTFGPAGLSAEEPLEVYMTCRWKKVPLGGFAASTNPEYEQELTVTQVKVVLAKVDLVEVDVLLNIWKVKGVDIYAKWRANLGGGV